MCFAIKCNALFTDKDARQKMAGLLVTIIRSVYFTLILLQYLKVQGINTLGKRKYSPMNIMLVSFRYALHTFSVSRISRSGNRITGTNDVTAKGTASVIQYMDISMTTYPHFAS
jgi:hypothetical protein